MQRLWRLLISKLLGFKIADVILLANAYKNSSGDEIANVLVNDDIAHT